MPQPTLSEVHVSRPLSAIAIAWFNDNPGVASSVFPMVPVKKSTDKFWIWNLNDLLRIEAKKRAPGAQSAGTGFGLTTDSYRTDKFSLHTDLPWDITDEADEGLDLENSTSLSLIKNVKMSHEQDWGDSYFKPAIWSSNKDGSTADFV